MIQRYAFALSITQVAPFLQSGLAQASIGFDATPLVDQRGRLILSGDQIEGYVSAVMETAGLADLADHWFGSEGVQIEDGLPGNDRRARIKIFDLSGDRAPDDWKTYSRVKVAEFSGAAEAGSLQVIAQSHAPLAEVNFTGQGWVLAESETEAEEFIVWVRAALEMIPALGAIKTGGFGRIADFEVGPPQAGCMLAPANVRGPDTSECGIELTFEQPFLVDPDQRSGNVFDSAEIIPGQVIKGAIAEMLRLGGAIADFDDLLSAMTIRHAFPGVRRPAVAPLSLVVVGDRLVDVVQETSSGMPRFQADWKDKDWKLADGWYQPGSMRRHVRTRTAVQAGSLLPDDGKLFSQRMIATYDDRGALCVWNSAFLLPDGVDAAMRMKLGSLAKHLSHHGILRIGKTGAPARVAQTRLEEQVAIADGSTWRITLQTPAWMIPPSALLDDKGNPLTSGDAKPLYERFFEQQGGCLIDFMAAQDWWGGARAVGPKSAHQGQYYPWLVTRPGSVFVVKGIDRQKLNSWHRMGLELPAGEQKDWTNCPLVPENGFGEIRVERHV